MQNKHLYTLLDTTYTTINNLIRDFTDADTMRHRALEDYNAGV